MPVQSEKKVESESVDPSRAQGDLRERIRQLEAAVRSLRQELLAPSRAEIDRAIRADFHALRFRVGAALCAVPIHNVKEIVRYVRVTPIADLPASVPGAIDVRGLLVPVIDARIRFGQSVSFAARGTAIVLLVLPRSTVGIIVDEVLDVVAVAGENSVAPSGVLAGASCIASITTIEGEVVQILDVAELLTTSEWEAVTGALESTRPMVPDVEAFDVPRDD
ncbi:MAG: purine-binding chemotaxis protein CheW [Polyangiaceae bacterium]|nr:purine-binding chemotaxis protein CheW [Polyangiaceae bacterium]